MLLKEIRAIAGDAVVLSPEDRDAEDANTTWFGAPPHERMGMSAGEVVAAFEEVVEALRARVARGGHDCPATFYVWHDQEAGQLRCSVRSTGHDDLPFGGDYRVIKELDPIVTEFLEDKAPGAIAWGSLDPVPYPQDDEWEQESAAVAVWACDLRA